MTDEEILNVIPLSKEEWDIVIEDLELRIEELEKTAMETDVPLSKEEGGEVIKNQATLIKDMKKKVQDLLNTSPFNEAEVTFAPIKNLETGQLQLDFNEEVGSTTNKITKIMELWEGLTPEEKEQISEHYEFDVLTREWLVNELGDMIVNKKPKEIIERLKKCS